MVDNVFSQLLLFFLFSLNIVSFIFQALLHSSHMYHEAKHSFASHGVKVASVEVDLPAMLGQKDKAVSNLTRGIEGLFKKNKITYVKGYGKLISPSEVSVETLDGENTIVKGKNIIIATGSDVRSLPGITIDEKKIVSSTGALSLSEVPRRLVVIGAGYIGLEMGSVWGRLGSEVTVVEFGPDIVPTMDGELRKSFKRVLEKQKMKFKLQTKVVGVETSDTGVKLTIEPAAGGEQTILETDVVLVSAGRIPFTAGLGLVKLGIEMDKAGQILIDHKFVTNVPGIQETHILPQLKLVSGFGAWGPGMVQKCTNDRFEVNKNGGTGGLIENECRLLADYVFPTLAWTLDSMSLEGCQFLLFSSLRVPKVDDLEDKVVSRGEE